MVKKQIEIEARYDGYIKRQREEVQRMKEMGGKTIPADIDYRVISGLSNELKGKLCRVMPATIGQAERIPGMTQAALTTITIATKKRELEEGWRMVSWRMVSPIKRIIRPLFPNSKIQLYTHRSDSYFSFIFIFPLKKKLS